MDLHTEGTYSWREVCVRFGMDMDLHTEGGTYSWREVCVRFRMDFNTVHTEGVHLFMEGSLC